MGKSKIWNKSTQVAVSRLPPPAREIGFFIRKHHWWALWWERMKEMNGGQQTCCLVLRTVCVVLKQTRRRFRPWKPCNMARMAHERRIVHSTKAAQPQNALQRGKTQRRCVHPKSVLLDFPEQTLIWSAEMDISSIRIFKQLLPADGEDVISPPLSAATSCAIPRNLLLQIQKPTQNRPCAPRPLGSVSLYAVVFWLCRDSPVPTWITFVHCTRHFPVLGDWKVQGRGTEGCLIIQIGISITRSFTGDPFVIATGGSSRLTFPLQNHCMQCRFYACDNSCEPVPKSEWRSGSAEGNFQADNWIWLWPLKLQGHWSYKKRCEHLLRWWRDSVEQRHQSTCRTALTDQFVYRCLEVLVPNANDWFPPPPLCIFTPKKLSGAFNPQSVRNSWCCVRPRRTRKQQLQRQHGAGYHAKNEHSSPRRPKLTHLFVSDHAK